MNRRDVLAGLALTYLAARPGVAAAQSGAARPMHKWAYSTEGFDRLVHRIDGTETLVAHGSPMPVFAGFFEGPDATLPRPDGGTVRVAEPVARIVEWLKSVQVAAE